MKELFLEYQQKIEQFMIFDLMVGSLMEEEGMTEEDAAEWIDYNCSYYFDGCPIIIHRLE